jgi:hypothetical protein
LEHPHASAGIGGKVGQSDIVSGVNLVITLAHLGRDRNLSGGNVNQTPGPSRSGASVASGPGFASFVAELINDIADLVRTGHPNFV